MVGGTLTQQGRIEIWYNSQWNTVCDDYWDLSDANVVCQQLGYRGALAAHQSAHFGQGSGQILLDNLECTGTEATLFECNNNGINMHNCDHSEDASVTCEYDECLDNVSALNCYICKDFVFHKYALHQNLLLSQCKILYMPH